ncbi:Cytochrome P450 2J5 [Orchesella cincta]|uniref:Cytochrome P450 2J5 n=1 Tax=Orchesella cincta TaxID=48709 RepID=A0A1D2N6L5_ORCCI|nr:Cytochrome P450 2J5 [Orchesella cincta]
MFSMTVWIFIVVGLLTYLAFKPRKRTINLPGPWALPFVGSMLEIEPRMYLTLHKWSKKYGPMCKFQIGAGPSTVLIADPIIAKEMLSLDPFVGRATVKEFTLFEGENIGLINAEGKIWADQRRFTVRQLRDFGFGKSSMESMIMEEVNEMKDRLLAYKGRPIDDIKNMLSLAMLNSLWSIVAGTRYSQDDPKLRELARQITGAFDEAAKAGAVLVLAPWLKHIIPGLIGYTSIRRTMRGLVDFVSKTIKEHKETVQEESPRDFIDVYLNEIKRTADVTSSFHGENAERQLIAAVADLFQAGTDSMSSTLNWALLYLLKLPEVQRKLQAEIKAVTGNSRPVSFSDRPKMPYSLAVINEVLRKAAPPFGVPHRVLVDTEYKGVFFPKDTGIMINLYYIHSDPKLWGDPENFRPERFLTSDEKGLEKTENLNPFLIGRRQCPGETLAKDTIFLFLTNLVQKFNILADPNSPEPDLEPAVSFIVQSKPYQVVFQERKD